MGRWADTFQESLKLYWLNISNWSLVDDSYKLWKLQIRLLLRLQACHLSWPASSYLAKRRNRWNEVQQAQPAGILPSFFASAKVKNGLWIGTKRISFRSNLLFRFSLRSSAAAVFDDAAILICGPFEESDVCFIYDPARRYIARKQEKLVNSGIGPNSLFNWKGKAYQCGIQKWEALIRFDVLSSLYGEWDRWVRLFILVVGYNCIKFNHIISIINCQSTMKG